MHNIIYEPRVYLISRQQVDRGELNRFLFDHHYEEWDYSGRTEPHLIVETAGRLCYLSFLTGRTSSSDYMANIIAVGHGSVLEHAVWGFIFTGISRTFTHELVRHRAGMSYSQLSQRYVNESDAKFVMPPALIGQQKEHEEEQRVWVEEVTEDQKNYIARVERMMQWPEFKAVESVTDRRKAVREAARSNLPNSTESMVFVTGNARAWRNFLELRVSRFAEREMRRLSSKVWEILVVEAPTMFGDYTKVFLPDGSYELATEHRKV